MNEQKQRDYLLPASILIAGVLISGSVFYLVGSRSGGVSGNPSVGEQLAAVGAAVAPKATDRDVILGNPNAPVTFIEYGDYQCPFCARFFRDTEPRLREEYIKTGKVRMVFKNFQFLGPESFVAAEAAECAKDQKQFWAFHDAIYSAEIQDGREHNGNLNRDLFISIAADLKLDARAFGSCIDSRKYKSQVEKESDEARTYDVNSTPTVFVNGKKVTGALPYESFKAVIEGELSAAGK